jgi:hypothetical protein
MPRGPKGEKRPADAIGNAVMIGRIATGEIEDLTTDDGKNAAAVALGRMGGKARAEGMTAKRQKEIAKKAAKSRWGKARPPLSEGFFRKTASYPAGSLAIWVREIRSPRSRPLRSLLQSPHRGLSFHSRIAILRR